MGVNNILGNHITWSIGQLCGYPEALKKYFYAFFEVILATHFHQNFTKTELWNFVLIILSKNVLEDKRTPETTLNVKKVFMEFLLWGIFSNFDQNMKGRK